MIIEYGACTMTLTAHPLSRGYWKWIFDEILTGWSQFYVSIMFAPLPGTQGARDAQMQRIIQGPFYSELCKRLDRHSRRRGRHQYSPHVILFPDMPVFKHQKQSLAQVTLNGGLHYNG